MKTVDQQSKASIAMEKDQSENQGSCYYPGCRKDVSCNCEICLASINATLDLMPSTNIQCTPIRSSAPANRSNSRRFGFYVKAWKLLLALSFILFGKVVLSQAVSGIFKAVLSLDVMERVGEKLQGVKDLNGKLRFLQEELQSIVDGEVLNCGHANSIWEIDEDGLLLNSRCTLFKTALEEVAIWGWPLQTVGLLTTGYSFCTFTILSDRVTEWSGGQISHLI